MIKNKDDVIQYLTNVANYELAESIKSAKTIEQVIVAQENYDEMFEVIEWIIKELEE